MVAAQERRGEAGVRALPVMRLDGGLAGLLTVAYVGEPVRLLAVRPHAMGVDGARRAQMVEQGPF